MHFSTISEQQLSKIFVYVVDSYANDNLQPDLESLGLKQHKNYDITGAGGADMILDVNPWINADTLIVFMSSFYGSVAPAIELSKKIKEMNPNAKIFFRSATEHSVDDVFEKSIRKQRDNSELIQIISGLASES